MIKDRRGSNLLEWIVGIVIVIAVVGTAVYAVFNSLGQKFLGDQLGDPVESREAVLIRKPVATSMVEYIVLITLIVGLMGLSMLAVVTTIWNKLTNVSVQLGS